MDCNILSSILMLQSPIYPGLNTLNFDVISKINQNSGVNWQTSQIFSVIYI